MLENDLLIINKNFYIDKMILIISKTLYYCLSSNLKLRLKRKSSIRNKIQLNMRKRKIF